MHSGVSSGLFLLPPVPALLPLPGPTRPGPARRERATLEEPETAAATSTGRAGTPRPAEEEEEEEPGAVAVAEEAEVVTEEAAAAEEEEEEEDAGGPVAPDPAAGWCGGCRLPDIPRPAWLAAPRSPPVSASFPSAPTLSVCQGEQ